MAGLLIADTWSHPNENRSRQIVTAIPSALTIILPNNWFDGFPDNISVFEALYRWMVTTRGVAPDRYFIQAGTAGPIKIGYSSGLTKRRIATLQTAHSEPLRLLAELTGDRDTETELHRRFSAHRKSGEWFAPHPDLIEFIAVLRRESTTW